MKEGRKEERKEERKAGRRKEGRKQGRRKEGRRKEGMKVSCFSMSHTLDIYVTGFTLELPFSQVLRASQQVTIIVT